MNDLELEADLIRRSGPKGIGVLAGHPGPNNDLDWTVRAFRRFRESYFCDAEEYGRIGEDTIADFAAKNRASSLHRGACGDDAKVKYCRAGFNAERTEVAVCKWRELPGLKMALFYVWRLDDAGKWRIEHVLHSDGDDKTGAFPLPNAADTCATTPVPVLPIGAKPDDDVEVWFPPGTMSPYSSADTSRREANARLLDAANEPSLHTRSPDFDAAFRLLLQPSFFPLQLLRVQSGNGRATAVRRASEAGEGWNLKLKSTREAPLALWSEIVGMFESSGFWTMPNAAGPTDFDGVFCYLEAQIGGRYHIVCRQSPDRGRFIELCRSLCRACGAEDEFFGKHGI